MTTPTTAAQAEARDKLHRIIRTYTPAYATDAILREFPGMAASLPAPGEQAVWLAVAAKVHTWMDVCDVAPELHKWCLDEAERATKASEYQPPAPSAARWRAEAQAKPAPSACVSEASAATEPGTFAVGDDVEKWTGDYSWQGVVSSVFTTPDGHTRYVVAHPVGRGHVLHIYGPQNLRSALQQASGERKTTGATDDR